MRKIDKEREREKKRKRERMKERVREGERKIGKEKERKGKREGGEREGKGERQLFLRQKSPKYCQTHHHLIKCIKYIFENCKFIKYLMRRTIAEM